MAIRRERGGRGTARLIIGASLLIGLVAGCRSHGPVILDHNESAGTVGLKDTGGQPVTLSVSKFDVSLQN